MAAKTQVTVIDSKKDCPVLKRMDKYAKLVLAMNQDLAVQNVLRQLKELDVMKAEIIEEAKLTPEFKAADLENGLEFKTLLAQLKFTKGTETKALKLSVEETIKRLSLAVCLPAITLSASKIESLVGTTNSDEFLSVTTGDRKLSALKIL